MSKPGIVTAIPKRRYRLGEFSLTVLGDILKGLIPVYFISLPFVIAGGLFVLYFTIGEFLGVFVESFSLWLANG